jgi:hypothetical protein
MSTFEDDVLADIDNLDLDEEYMEDDIEADDIDKGTPDASPFYH